jgi:diketogulonate reductase-like aldo/keto reductase
MSHTTAPVPDVVLNNGVTIPQVGFGVFQVPAGGTQRAVELALEAGYRSIDTAAAYGNEREVGLALAASGLERDEVFVTTKLWNDDQGHDATLAAFDTSLELLGLDTVDLYLVHWPAPGRSLYTETWRAFERLAAEGRVRAIGVSNIQVAHLERLFDEFETVPAVNQIELHPYLQQTELRTFHQRHGIATEAWSPLAKAQVIDDPTIVTIAEAHEKTPAQVVLRWHLELGNIVIPKSVTAERIVANLDLFDFHLTNVDIDAIAGLERDHRTGPHPDHFG